MLTHASFPQDLRKQVADELNQSQWPQMVKTCRAWLELGVPYLWKEVHVMDVWDVIHMLATECPVSVYGVLMGKVKILMLSSRT